MQNTQLSSLLYTAPGGNRTITIEGPTTKIAGYQPVQLNNRFGELFKKSDTAVVCELSGGGVIVFRSMQQLSSCDFSEQGILQIHAVPILAWEHVKMSGSNLKMLDLLGANTISNWLKEPPAPPPLDRNA